MVSDPASPPIPGSAAPPPDGPRLASTRLRIARPSRDIAKAEAFWAGGLGLTVLHRAGPDAEGEHALLMAGWPGAAWHLELAGDPAGEPPPAPAEEDLPVLTPGAPADDALIRRLVHAGGQLISATNPYWEHWGVTIADPTATGSYSVNGHGSEQHRPRQADADPATQSASLSANRTRQHRTGRSARPPQP